MSSQTHYTPTRSPIRESPADVLLRYASAPPPVDLRSMVADLGLGLKHERLSHGISGKLLRDKRYPAGFCVIVNETEPLNRQRFTIAHEMAHYVLHRDLIGDGVTDNAMYRSSLSDEFERQADQLAGKILLPAQAVKDAYRAGNVSFAKLSEMFTASQDAIRIRLKELGLGP
jgi:hypothetical protein